MPSLVAQIQAEALDGKVPVTALLRRAKAAAVKLNQMESAVWIERELSGYPSGTEIPAYRKLHGELRYFNPYHGWQPIIGLTNNVNNGQPIAEIVALLESDGGFFVAPVSPKFSRRVCEELGFAADVKSHISRAAMAGIVEAVRNAVLDWALKLELAGVKGEGMAFSKAEADRARDVTINIGSIGNAVGIGSFHDQATINSTQSFTPAELTAAVLKLVEQTNRLLAPSDLPAKIKNETEAALAELHAAAVASRPDKGRIRAALGSLKEIMEHAAGHVVGAGVLAMIAQIHPAL